MQDSPALPRIWSHSYASLHLVAWHLDVADNDCQGQASAIQNWLLELHTLLQQSTEPEDKRAGLRLIRREMLSNHKNSSAEGGVSSLATTDGPEASTSGATGGYELAVADTSSGGGGKILGSRDFARYYRQNHRPETRDRTTRLAELQQR